jgi:hypothetical protein
MTDRYEKIRQALAMEPTPGPRRVIDGNSYPYVAVTLPENEGRRWNDPIICQLYEDVTPDPVALGPILEAMPNAQANAYFIAACDPDTIQALLDEREALRNALKKLITWMPSADTYRRLGFDPEAPMRALKDAKKLVEE